MMLDYIFFSFQKISQSALGKLVLEAVDKSVDPMMGEIQVENILIFELL